MKLELKHLAPYSPYGLKWSLQGLRTLTMSGLTSETLYTEEGSVLVWQKHDDLPQALFPILHPLSEYGGDVLAGEIMKKLDCSLDTVYELWNLMDGDIKLDNIKYSTYLVMCRNLIDFNGLIEAGLAIDINTLNK